MSNSPAAHEEAHTGPVKTPKQFLLLSVYAFVIPVLIIIGLVYYVVSSSKPAASASDLSRNLAGVTAENAERALEARIQKIGTIEIKDANRALVSGEEVFKVQCAGCHVSGAAGAPKLADTAAWGARIAQGLETLVNSALKGKNNMGAQGGGNYEDVEIARAVVYMANAAGAKFAEPQRAASGAASAASGQ
jgi:cytochrome c5